MMIQALNSALTSLNSENYIQFLCFYINATDRLQKIRLTDISKAARFEKIVFPGQRILFEASLEFSLEVYTIAAGREVLLEILPCHALRVVEEIDFFEIARVG